MGVEAGWALPDRCRDRPPYLGTAQLPFYTIWWSGTARENLVAVVHCTGGDVLITTTTLLIAALVARRRGWHQFSRRMVITVIVLGVTYTILSEWLNVEVWRSWSYSSAMPALPWLGTGLSPLLQWFVIPALAFAITSGSWIGIADTARRA